MKQWFELPVNKTQSPKGMLHHYNYTVHCDFTPFFVFTKLTTTIDSTRKLQEEVDVGSDWNINGCL